MKCESYITPDNQIWARIDDDVWACVFNMTEDTFAVTDKDIWSMYASNGGVLIYPGKKVRCRVRNS